MFSDSSIIPVERIESRILLIRGKKVLIDRDLAELYGIETKRLNAQVHRNQSRFPEDFLFRLTSTERDEVVAKCVHLSKLKFSPSLPYVFTEHGAIMAATVLNSERAVAVSVFVVRAFVKLREIATTTRELEVKLIELEQRIGGHDEQIKKLVMAIHQLMLPPQPVKKQKMGF